MSKIQGIPVAANPVVEKQKVEDPTIVRRILKGIEVEKVIVENGGHHIVFSLADDVIEEITFPSHPNGSLADLINLVNRLRIEADASFAINNRLAQTI